MGASLPDPPYVEPNLASGLADTVPTAWPCRLTALPERCYSRAIIEWIYVNNVTDGIKR